FKWLKEADIVVHDVNKQNEIVGQLDLLTSMMNKHQLLLDRYDELVKSRFVEMFGSPITNDKNLPIASLGSCLQGIENGKSFVCDSNSRTGKQPGVLKLSAATYGIYKPEENKAILSADDFVEQAEVHAGDLLFTRKNTPELVGMSAYVWQTPEKLMMPDLIFRLIPNQQMHPIFLWKLINHDVFRCKIQELATGTAKSMSNISKERLRNLEIIVPPIKLQNQFADFVVQTDKSKLTIQKSMDNLMELRDSLLQEYFG
ncbi:MAG: restriction endonuclease subunit S, partial [Prevotella sp.]|nr:restriction endonuclease subunit S [Prevotella sp.]